MKQKRFSITFTMPELAASKAIQCVTLTGTGAIGLMFKRGLEQVKKRDGVKGKRITVVNAKMTISDAGDTEQA